MTNPTPDVVVLPVLPLRNTVLFPALFLPLAVGRSQSVAAVEAVMATEETSRSSWSPSSDSSDEDAGHARCPLHHRHPKCFVIKKMAPR